MTGADRTTDAIVANEAPEWDTAARSGFSRLRSEFRLARRTIMQSRRASVLVLVLIALPVMAMSAGLVFWASHQPTLEQQVTLELGQSQARFDIVSAPDASLTQDPQVPLEWTAGDEDTSGLSEADWLTDPIALLPAGTRVIDVAMGIASVETPIGATDLSVTIGESWDPALAGRFELLSGRSPGNALEAMVSPGTLERLGVTIGDSLVLAKPAATFTIVGTMKAADQATADTAIFLPRTEETSGIEQVSQWFTPDWQPDAAALSTFNQQGVIVAARDLMMQGDASRLPGGDTSFASVATPALLAIVFSGYVVALIAGSAFAISARRQQHSLAIAVSVGASRGSVFRSVLLQGSILGLIGASAGALLGVAAAYPLLLWNDNGQVQSFWGFSVPWWGVFGLVAFGVVAGTMAALIPARNATRGDALSALRGARRPADMHPRLPVWGIALLVTGLVLTVVSALAVWGIDPKDPSESLRALWSLGIAAGPVFFQVGVLLSGRWLLAAIARIPAPSLPVWRLAARDTAAHPSRFVPAFAAVAACVFVAALAVSGAGLADSLSRGIYLWQGPKDSLVFQLTASADGAQLIEAQARTAAEYTGAQQIATLRGELVEDINIPPSTLSGTTARIEVHNYESCAENAEPSPVCLSPMQAKLSAARLLAVDPAEAETAIGMPLTPEARAVLDNGGILILGTDFFHADVIVDGTVTVNTWPISMLEAEMTGVDDASAYPDPVGTHQLAAIRVMPPHPLPYTALISTETAVTVGLPAFANTLIATFDGPAGERELELAGEALSSTTGELGSVIPFIEAGPDSADGFNALVLGAAGVLVLGVSSVALGLARLERRTDDAILVAIGATPGIRRGLAFWQALLVVGIGSVTGTIAGVIPVWGVSLAAGDISLGDVPWGWMAGLAFAVPLAVAAVNGLVPPRKPDLTQRTAIA